MCDSLFYFPLCLLLTRTSSLQVPSYQVVGEELERVRVFSDQTVNDLVALLQKHQMEGPERLDCIVELLSTPSQGSLDTFIHIMTFNLMVYSSFSMNIPKIVLTCRGKHTIFKCFDGEKI